jgi:plastocyanin
MRRLALILGVVVGVLAGPGAAALAVDQTVNASGGDLNAKFTPASVTITAGETVHWHNSDGTHNVVFDDGSFKGGGDPITHAPADTRWDAQFTFNSAGTFRFFCENHGDKNGVGMSGKVIVQAAGGGDVTPPSISSLGAKPSKFCNKKTTKCKKPGTQVKFTLSEPASVTADVTSTAKGSGPVIVFQTQGKAGKNSVKFPGKAKASGKRLKAGKYSLRLIATDASSNKSPPVTTNIKITK